MSDMRNGMNDQRARRDICVDAYRILDSCKDKDCFEDTRLMLTDFGQEILERSGSVRVTNTSVVWTDITVDPLKFNRGFYQISIRFFTKVTLEACVGLGKAQEIEGIAVNEKKVVLFGGEGNVNIFRSGDMPDEFCSYGMGNETFIKSKPTAVVEVIDPVALSVKIPSFCISTLTRDGVSTVILYPFPLSTFFSFAKGRVTAIRCRFSIIFPPLFLNQ